MTAQTGKGQHTAGPWRVVPHYEDDGRRLVVSDGTNPNGTDSIIADVWHVGAGGNACLIAAAPALLEALRAIERTGMLDENDGSLGIAARAAIKLAEGDD